MGDDANDQPDHVVLSDVLGEGSGLNFAFANGFALWDLFKWAFSMESGYGGMSR
jgi:hypothetical protein